MRTKENKILEAIKSNKELTKRLNALSYYTENSFIRDAENYLKAIKEGRMLCCIGSVSASGMSRSIKFISCEKSKHQKGTYYYSNYFAFFKALGYSESRSKDHFFNIGGCGMNMIFHTNYTIIHRLYRLGFITKLECEKLAQMTPTTI